MKLGAHYPSFHVLPGCPESDPILAAQHDEDACVVRAFAGDGESFSFAVLVAKGQNASDAGATDHGVQSSVTAHMEYAPPHVLNDGRIEPVLR